MAQLRRLLPDPASTTVEEQYSDLQLGDLAATERPYVVMNFVATLDGRATIEGRSGPIGSRTDSAVLHRLRTQADAVMIGAGTMRVERYGRIVPEPGLRAYRERIGLAHDPLAVLISGRLDLPWDAPLFTDGGGRIVVFTSSETEPPQTRTTMRVVRHEDGVDLGSALAYLRTERGIRSVLCEGGPILHAQLQAAGLADELFLTIAPMLSGGVAPRILEGELPEVPGLELVWLLESEGELFARYRRA